MFPRPRLSATKSMTRRNSCFSPRRMALDDDTEIMIYKIVCFSETFHSKLTVFLAVV